MDTIRTAFIGHGQTLHIVTDQGIVCRESTRIPVHVLTGFEPTCKRCIKING